MKGNKVKKPKIRKNPESSFDPTSTQEIPDSAPIIGSGILGSQISQGEKDLDPKYVPMPAAKKDKKTQMLS